MHSSSLSELPCPLLIMRSRHFNLYILPLFLIILIFFVKQPLQCLICLLFPQTVICTNMEESTVTKQWRVYLTKIHIYQEQRPFESVTIYVLCILYSDHPISFHHCIFSHICTNISLFQEKAGRLNIEGVIWQKNHYYQKQRPIRSATNPKIDSIKN